MSIADTRADASHRSRAETRDEPPSNRDPRRWQNPDAYDITRRTSGHVGFGSGVHMCVGQLFSRIEGEAMLAALARRVDALEITGPVKRAYNNTLRGLESLPITLHPATA